MGELDHRFRTRDPAATISERERGSYLCLESKYALILIETSLALISLVEKYDHQKQVLQYSRETRNSNVLRPIKIIKSEMTIFERKHICCVSNAETTSILDRHH